MANLQAYMNYSKAEIPATQYYVHRSYLPTYYYIYMSIEDWIAKNLFRNDLSRVFMASNEYAFRRRFELTDMSQDYDKISASSLNFPFANFNILNTGWQPDTRPAANTAAQVYLGVYEQDVKIRAASVLVDIPVVFYFDREDDARLAYDKLLFFTYNKHYYSTEVSYGGLGFYPDGEPIRGQGKSLQLPIALQISNLIFNPDFKESNWLKQNRIFTIQAKFSIRTYAIYPPEQPDYNLSVDSAGHLVDQTGTITGYYGDGSEHYYIVEDVILNLMQVTHTVESYNGLSNFPPEGQKNIVYIDTSVAEDQKGTIEHPKMRELKAYLWNDVSKKYEETPLVRKSIINTYDLAIDSLGINGEKPDGIVKVKHLTVKDITSNSGTLSWDYDQDFDLSLLNRIQISLNNQSVLDTTDVKDFKSFTFKDLTSASTYTICIQFHSTQGSISTFYEELTTKIGSEIKNNRTPKSSIVGTTW